MLNVIIVAINLFREFSKSELSTESNVISSLKPTNKDKKFKINKMRINCPEIIIPKKFRIIKFIIQKNPRCIPERRCLLALLGIIFFINID